MTQTDHSPPSPPTTSFAARIAWTILIAVTLYICYFHDLGAIGLVGPDEPRYAWIARAMAETGDWITPRLYGKPWFEKPPLYYWGAALCFKLFGVTEVTARLPSAISAFLATLAMGWLAWCLYGAETARWLLLLLPTTVGMIGFSHAAATDMPFAAMLTLAMVCAAHLLGLVPADVDGSSGSFASFTSSPSFTSFFFGFFLGLAALAKGPAAIILSGGAIFLWALFTKRWRNAFHCLHPVAIASFCLTALPWYVLCDRRNPDFFRIFIVEHNFKRYLTPEFQHIQPFWFYVPITMAAMLPWILLLLGACFGYVFKSRFRTRMDGSTIFLLCWAGFAVLFFSASKSKLPGYILPVIPVLGTLLAKAITVLFSDLRRPIAVSTFLTTCAAGLAALSAPNWVPPRFREFCPYLELLLGGLTLSFALLGIAFLVRKFVLIASLLGFGALISFLCIFGLLSQRAMLRRSGISDLSSRDLAQSVRAAGGRPGNLHLVNLKRSQQYQLGFYLHGELQEWRGEAREGDLLLGEAIDCDRLLLQLHCTDLWERTDLKTGDWALLRISGPSLPAGPAGLGAPRTDDNLRHGRDRQPR